MFEKPAKKDIDAALSLLMHDARHRTQDAKDRITNEMIAASAAVGNHVGASFGGNRIILAVAEAADKAHQDAIEAATKRLLEFVDQMQLPATQITEWARPHLQNLSNSVLGVVPPNNLPNERARILQQKQAVFDQRVDLALREVEIGYIKGAGFAARTAMPEEDWISAAEAVALVAPAMHNFGMHQAIAKRARAGLVKARAVRYIHARGTDNNADLPEEFWWAEGGAALNQNWTTGDFQTWIKNDTIRLQAFGVTFRRADIEAMIPPPSPPVPLLPEPMTTRGGRPRSDYWEDMWVEISRQLYTGDLKHDKQADIAKAMKDWLSSAKNVHPADSSIRERARKLWKALNKAEN